MHLSLEMMSQYWMLEMSLCAVIGDRGSRPRCLTAARTHYVFGLYFWSSLSAWLGAWGGNLG
jgi:hypothetical protein